MPHCQTYIKTLRNLGYRITPQREMIIEALAHSPHHMTAEEIYGQVHERTRAVNIATIYRTLDLLVEQGMASRAGLQDGRVGYAASSHGPHLHLVCRACGNAIDASQDVLVSLEGQLSQQYGFAADLQHLTIAGLCSSCRSESHIGG
jgi:Fur family transcriptional regulator, ferric uptake regulator